MEGKITLVGAGPGAEDLITIRGKKALDEADVIMKKLRNSFETAAADDKSAPLMDNAQKVYAGMTYGRGRLTESFINDDNRGFLA